MEAEEMMEGGMGAYQTPMNTLGSSSILFMSNPDEELKEIERIFRGKAVVNGREQLVSTPMMNDDGVKAMMKYLRAFINKNTYFGVLDKNERRQLMVENGQVCDTIIKELMQKRLEYGMTWQSRDAVKTIMMNTIYLAFTRTTSEGLSDKKFWRGSVQEFHQKVENGGNKGLLSKINPWSRN